MGLVMRWMVHSACHVLGYSSNEKVADHGGMKSTMKLHAIDSASLRSTTHDDHQKKSADCSSSGFQMPLHYPRYKKSDYEQMEEWKVDMLLKEYGLAFQGSLHQKRSFAMGTFLWPDQY